MSHARDARKPTRYCLRVRSIFKHAADLEPRRSPDAYRTGPGRTGPGSEEASLRSIWNLSLHPVGVEVDIPKPPRGFETDGWRRGGGVVRNVDK